MQIRETVCRIEDIGEFGKLTEMECKVIMKYKIEREIIELRWRTNKLEKMKNDRGCVKQKPGAGGEVFQQSQSSQFFLGLRLSRMVETTKELNTKEDIHVS